MSEHITHIAIHPDVAGHWSVTRDRVVDAEFSDLERATEYANACAHRVRKAGLQVRLTVHVREPEGLPPV